MILWRLLLSNGPNREWLEVRATSEAEAVAGVRQMRPGAQFLEISRQHTPWK